MYTLNDFFCGCGGLGLGFQNAGFQIVGAWDFDKYAVESYRENVGDHVVQTDIQEMHIEDVPKADVWAFGFPCQDLSVAGKQAGIKLECTDCGEVWEVSAESYEDSTGNVCPACGGKNHKAATRSGLFFEIMRLLAEARERAPEKVPKVLVAENVKALRKLLPVLEAEYEKAGYKCHAQLFNSKYWGVPQNRERYIVVGTLDTLDDVYQYPEEQHDFVPKLSTILEKDVPENFYIDDEKAKKIIDQALERLREMGGVHATITPDRVDKRQNGRRAKEDEEPMFTLTAQDLHGVILAPGKEAAGSVNDSYEEKRNGKNAPLFPIKEATTAGVAVARYGDSINISFPESDTRRGRVGNEIAQTLMTGCSQVVICEDVTPSILNVGNVNPSGRGMNGCVYHEDGVSPALTTNKGEGIKVMMADRERESQGHKGNLPRINQIAHKGSGGQKGWIHDTEGIVGAVTATDYKDPKYILEVVENEDTLD